jgi:WD40 repeat protein
VVQLCRVFDIRMMRALAAYKGQNREVTSVTWHPHHEELFVSGGMDGSLMHWCVSAPPSLPPSTVLQTQRWVTLRACWVTLRARWVTLRARWVTLRARWVTLRAR